MGSACFFMAALNERLQLALPPVVAFFAPDDEAAWFRGVSCAVSASGTALLIHNSSRMLCLSVGEQPSVVGRAVFGDEFVDLSLLLFLLVNSFQ